MRPRSTVRARKSRYPRWRTASADGDDFAFEYSTDGVNITPVSLASLPYSANDIDLVGTLPAGLTGTVTIRVVDTDRTVGNQAIDTLLAVAGPMGLGRTPLSG